MAGKFYKQSGACLIFLMVLMLLHACAWADPNPKSSRRLGGPCQYKSYPGQATILSISERQTSHPDEVVRFDVQFSFVPRDKITENFAQAEGKTFHLYGNHYQYPDRVFLTSHNIHVGKVIEGSLQAIVSGTCTPVLFDFPTLKQKK